MIAIRDTNAKDIPVVEGSSREDIVKYQVDMMSSAKDAQWTKDFLGANEVLKVVAPAKVNLFLAVGDKRADGYHDVINIMHSLAFHDVLYIGRRPLCSSEMREDAVYAGPKDNLSVRIDLSDKTVSMHEVPFHVEVKDNLVYKAIDSLAKAVGYTEREEISVRIEKNIPMQAGLGGGSSDAAAALLASANFWGLPSDNAALENVAKELGADVAFFLQGGCAEFLGIGSEFSRVLEPMRRPVVVVKPKTSGVSTKLAYEAFDRLHLSIPVDLLHCAENAQSAEDVPLFNNLSSAAFEICPEAQDILNWLGAADGVASKDGEAQCLLSGSGAAVFAITNSFSDASRIAAAATAKGLWARATTFCQLHVSVLKAD